MITFTTPNTHFQQKWVQKLSDGSKVCMTLLMLCFFLFTNVSSLFAQTNSFTCKYTYTLESRTYTNGQTTFIWSVMNPNPGNGSGSTVQDLSHWGIVLPTCPGVNFNNAIVSAGVSTNGTTYENFKPEIKPDKSQDCTGNTQVLKFDYGTSGRAKTYYRLVLNGNFGTGLMNLYYKSGTTTGCGLCTSTGVNIGVGCLQPSCPTVTFTGLPTANICPAASIDLNASVAGGTFAANVSGLINATTGVFTAPNVTVATNYTITYTLPNCPAIQVGTITVAPCQQQPNCPVVTFTGRPTANICPGTMVTLVPSVAGGTFGGTTAITSAGVFTAPSVTTATTYTITYTLPNCPAVQVGTITVAPCQQTPACPYTVTLVSNNYNSATNQTTFIWSVVNPNPGNGSGGTAQDLSWWGFVPNVNCPPGMGLDEADIVSTGWGNSANAAATNTSLDTDIETDNSCPVNVAILKFDRGTSGSTATYYSLVLRGNWNTGTMSYYFKSGTNTGCGGPCTFTGVGCQQPTPIPGCPVVTPIITTTTATICPSATTGVITVTNPQAGVTYQLYRNDVAVTGQVVVYASGTVSFTGLQAGTYTVRGTNTANPTACPAGTSAPVVISTVVIPAPTFGTIGTLCPGATVNLMANFPSGTTVTGATWSGTGVSGSVFTAPTASGTYTITYSATVNGCPFTTTLNIVVAAPPAPVFGTIGTLCPGATANLTATFPSGTTVTGATWSGTGVSGSIFTAPAAAGTYTINYSATVNGCPVSGSFTITVANVPAPTFNTIGTLCPGATANLTATFAAGVTVTGATWTGTGVSGSVFTAPAAGGTYTITYSATVNGCPFTTTRTITVANVPAPTFGAIGTLCPGTTANLTAIFPAGTNVTGATWSGTGVSGSIFTAGAAGNYTINYSATVNGCPVTGSFVITVAAAPAPAFGTIGILCPGATANLTATFPAGATVTNVMWSGTGVTGSVFTAGAAGTYTINYSALVNGCPVSGSFTITVANVPAPTFNTIGTLCPGATANLTATFAAGVTVTGATWTGTGVSGSVFTAPVAGGTYTITYSATVNGCPFTTTRTITVANVPIPVFGTIGQLCPGQAVSLTATFPAGTTVTGATWSGTGVSGSTFTAPTTAGNYTITYSATVNGCPVTGSFVIVVVAAPAVNFNLAVTSGILCPGGGGSVILTLSGSQIGVSYQLLRNGVAVGAPVAGTGTAISFGAQTVAGSYSVVATATAISGNECVICPVTIGPINVAPATLPTPSTGALPTSVCPGTTVPLALSFPAGTTVTNVTWSGTGVSGSTFTAPAAGGNYTITYNATVNGCPFTTTIVINVITVPAPVFGTIGVLCPGTTVNLTAIFPAGTTITGATWTGTGVSGSIFTAPTASGNYTINYSATVNGCAVTGSFVIVVAAPPAPVFGAIGTLCPGATANLTATFPAGTTVANVMWSGTGVTGSVFTAGAAGSYTINYSATVNGCPVTGSFVITVAAAPATQTVTDTDFCPGGTGTVTLASSQTGVSYQLHIVGGSHFGTPITGTGSAITFNNVPAGTYQVIATNISAPNCSVTFGNVTVAQLAAPTLTVVNQTVCPPATVNLNNAITSSTAGLTVTFWQGTTQLTAAQAAAISTSGTYTIRVTNAAGCIAQANVVVTINPLPATQTLTATSFCPGGTGTIVMASSQIGVSYQLQTTTGTNVGAAQAGTGGQLTFSGLAAGTYQVRATNATTTCFVVFGNVNVAAVVVTPCVINGPTNVCMGTTNTYTVTTGPGVTGIQWSVTGGNCTIVGSATTPSVTIRAIGPGTFIVRAIVSYGACTTTCELTVTSTPLVVSAPNIIVCPNTTTTLTGNPAGGVWASSNPQIQAAINNTNSTFNSTGIPAGNYPVTYTVTQGDGCTGTALGSITVMSPGVIGGLAGRLVADGSSGMEVTMKKSTQGIKYQLYRNGQKVGAPVVGTGRDISFGTQDINGDYSVTASTQNGDCSTSSSAGRIIPGGDAATARAGNLNVTAFPNPFNDRIRFTINSEYSGQGALEVYNLLGEKIKTVYEGYIDAGRSQTVDFQVPGAQRVNMIYKLRVGNHETSGKLINIK